MSVRIDMNRPRRPTERSLTLKLGGVRPPPDPGRFQRQKDSFLRCKSVLLGATAIILMLVLFFGTWTLPSSSVSMLLNTTERDQENLIPSAPTPSAIKENPPEPFAQTVPLQELDISLPIPKNTTPTPSENSTVKERDVEEKKVINAKQEEERKFNEEIELFRRSFPQNGRCDENSMSDSQGIDQLQSRCEHFCTPPVVMEGQDAFLPEEKADPYETVKLEYRCQAFWHQKFKSWEECKQALGVAKAQLFDHLCGVNGLCKRRDNTIHGTGKGVVIAAQPHQLILAVATIKWLHRAQTTPLSVQVFTDEEETFTLCEGLLISLPKVSCLLAKTARQLEVSFNASMMTHTLKIRAVMSSSFRDVIYLEPDAVPLLDPTPVFSSCEYKATGALFFPDFWGHACASLVWNKERALCGQSTSPEHVMWQLADSPWANRWPLAQEFLDSAFFVDRVRHYNALQVTLLIAEGPMRNTVSGLKDIFKFGWLTLGHEFTLSGERPAMMLQNHLKDNGATVLKRTSSLSRFKTRFLFANNADSKYDNGTSMAVPKPTKEASWCLKVFQEYSTKVIEKTHQLLSLDPSVHSSLAKWASFIAT